MEPTDLLALSAQAAHALRLRGDDPETGLKAGYKFLRKRPPQDGGDDLAVRIARLMCAAGERRADLLAFLWARPAGGVVLVNRPDPADGDSNETEPIMDPDPEAERLYKQVINSRRRVKQVEIFQDGFGSFSITRRQGEASFGSRLVRRRGGWFTFKTDKLPSRVRGLIDYPLQVQVLFPIEVGEPPWSIWDICCAFADQYVRVYERAECHGVWGHDLGDLSITGLTYYPDHELIHAAIAS